MRMVVRELPPGQRRRSDTHRSDQLAPSWGESKQQAVQAAARQVKPDVDARQALGFMPMEMKGAAIRWRGL
jgi:hypothetical protein